MRGLEPLSRRLRRRSSRVFAMGLFPLAATSAPGRNLSSPVGSAASQRHVTPVPPSGMRRLGDRPPSSPIDTKTLARASMRQGEVAPRSFSERFSPKPPLADSASIFSHSRPVSLYSLLRCRGEQSSTIHRPRARGEQSSTVARSCVVCRGEQSSTVHTTRGRKQNQKVTTLYRLFVLSSIVLGHFGPRVSEQRFHTHTGTRSDAKQAAPLT